MEGLKMNEREFVSFIDEAFWFNGKAFIFFASIAKLNVPPRLEYRVSTVIQQLNEHM